MTKKLTAALAAFLLAFTVAPAFAQRADDASRKSKNGKTTGEIDGVAVTLEYGRPHVKERDIWGALVPYGEIWRTGADEATTFTVSNDVTVEGKSLAAGTYSLFTIPGEKQWTVIFNKVPKQWGAYKYDASQDALRVDVTPQSHDHVEEMEFAIDGGSVVLHWEKLAVPFTVAKAQ